MVERKRTRYLHTKVKTEEIQAHVKAVDQIYDRTTISDIPNNTQAYFVFS